ncbi:MAG: TOBE domain-containing protein, partial [Phycisphaeraceae bacterium]|nr:TOBE domain-containing protein [Phycisphaeraceae bacterium]
FTASFLGETNFVDGTIESIEGESTVVKTTLGVLRSNRSLEKANVGDEVSVSLRPEAFRLGTPPENWNSVSTTLRRSMFLGETAQLEVATASDSMLKVLELHPRTDRSKGEKIELAIDPADVVLLPE